MLFKYKAIDEKGADKEGEIDAPNRDIAIGGLQRRGLVVITMKEQGDKKSIFEVSFFDKVKPKDVVVFSRQIATLFEAQVSALKAFTMLAANSESKLLAQILTQIGDDLQSGLSISEALAKHPEVFSDFYINMVKVGEETGKLNQTFLHLADYLDRQYALTSKTKNALIYPAFVIAVFFVVMSLMFTMVIPQLASIIEGSGQAVPFFTQIVIDVSSLFVHYGIFALIALVLLGIWVWRLSSTPKGKVYLDTLKLSTPVIGNLYAKLYLSRITDNLNTMISSGVPIVRALDITSQVVGSLVYKKLLEEVADGVKSGLSLSLAFEKHKDHIPPILVQMVAVGEETGSLGNILQTLTLFYAREVDGAVDTLVGLIEPVMIVVLGLGVGILCVSVLGPIYNMSSSIS
jgi:type IV pilus assembly protein PilC